MSKETIGTFIDAIYAIAVTILALEVPGEFEDGFVFGLFRNMLVEYALSFFILYALWIQQRRINGLNDVTISNTVIWIHGAILLLICLIPRATTLVFDYGGDVTLAQLRASVHDGAGWTLSEFADIFYVALVIGADVGLLILVVIATRNATNQEAIKIRQSKIMITALTVGVLLLSLLIPLENRHFLVLIPLALMFERKLSGLIFR